MTLRSSGFWSLTLGFFLLMQSNETPIPADPGQEIPVFSNETQVSSPVDETSGKVNVAVFESPTCAECHAFAIHSVIGMQQLYEHNPNVDIKVYLIPETQGSEGEDNPEIDMAKNMICAQQQEQFWPLYYELHAKEKVMNSQEIEKLITEKELKIDLETLRTCLADEKTQGILEQNQALAEVKRIKIYPSTLIQNIQLIHSQPLENLLRVIDKKALEITPSTPEA